MTYQYSYLSLEQQLRVAFAYLAVPDRCGTLHKNLRYADKWAAWGRDFDSFPLFRQAKPFM